MRPLSILLLLFSLLFPDDLRAGSQSNETHGNTSASQGNTPNPSYRLGVNDVIKVQVYGEDALTTETRVGGDGKISFPLLGVRVTYTYNERLSNLDSVQYNANSAMISAQAQF